MPPNPRSTSWFSLAARLSPVRAAVVFACLPLLLAALRAAEAPPRLERQGDAVQLLVKGRPFLVLGGELGNSSGEPDYLRPFWPKLKALHLNTVLAPVYWDLLEPTEGAFDFSSVDGLIHDARANQMHLVLLWFAAWKNSMSSYAPGWVKRDDERFPAAAIQPAGRWKSFHRSRPKI